MMIDGHDRIFGLAKMKRRIGTLIFTVSGAPDRRFLEDK